MQWELLTFVIWFSIFIVVWIISGITKTGFADMEVWDNG